jgi:hypothetical protein
MESISLSSVLPYLKCIGLIAGSIIILVIMMLFIEHWEDMR